MTDTLPRLVVDMAALGEPGSDRGLGRYVQALRGATGEISGYDFVPYPGRRRSRRHRFSEWLDVPDRTRFVRSFGPYFHATSAYHLSPLHASTTAVSIQDLIPLELPAYRQTGVKARVFFSCARRCSVIVTNSVHSAERVTELLGFPRNRIVVAPLPVTPRPTSDQSCARCTQLPNRVERYVISAIDALTPDPRKRFAWITGAARHLASAGIAVVVFGNGTAALNEHNLIGLGRLCDHHMRGVLRDAECFIYATAYEGQGLPPQEALAEGTPVVAFRNTSLPEMIGPGAAWLDEPASSWQQLPRVASTDPQARDLADAALALCDDQARRTALAAAGLRHITAFTPERFSLALTDAYDQLTSLRRTPQQALVPCDVA